MSLSGYFRIIFIRLQMNYWSIFEEKYVNIRFRAEKGSVNGLSYNEAII